MAPNKTRNAGPVTAQDARTERPPAVWGLFRGDFVSVQAYQDRIYLVARSVRRDTGQVYKARVALGYEAERQLRRLLAQADRQVVAHLKEAMAPDA